MLAHPFLLLLLLLLQLLRLELLHLPFLLLAHILRLDDLELTSACSGIQATHLHGFLLRLLLIWIKRSELLGYCGELWL